MANKEKEKVEQARLYISQTSLVSPNKEQNNFSVSSSKKTE
jgi:hypothetical protein